MEVKEVNKLANLLRDSGDKILNSEFKLTLSGSLLKCLNDCFSLITHESDTNTENGFQVVRPISIKLSVVQDLQLIYDFVQKTLSLCITNYAGEENFKETVDLKKFRSLVKLEIQKFDLNQIVGLQKLRPTLQQLICTRCLKNVDDIIVYCGKDNAMGFVWNELRIADFSYNALKKCDHALEFAAYLQNLNLSHNLLTSVEAIKWLPHLKILNLSFNRLSSIPIFHIEANRKLKILIINNNLIEVISTCRLESLTNFDLSNNFLLDHSNLLPLSTFSALNCLNLTGNPLFFHPKHREITAKYLHENTSIRKFVLDFEPLSKYEKSLTGKIKSFNPLYSTRSFTQINKSSGSSTPLQRCEREGDSRSTSSIDSFKAELNTTRKKYEPARRLFKNSSIIDLESPSNAYQSEETKSFLETKSKIEQLRKEHGSNWLQEQRSKDVFENILGLKQTSNQKDKIIPEDLFNEFLNSTNMLNVNSSTCSVNTLTSDFPGDDIASNLNIESSQNNESKTGDFKETIHSEDTKSIENVCESANDKNSNTIGTENTTSYQSTIEGNVPKVDKLVSLFEKTHIVSEDEQFSESEDTTDFYIAYTNNSTDEIFLTISDSKIRERDALTKRTLEKWSLKILESCDRIKSDTLRINFDTIREHKKERLYKIEESRCQELEKKLREILSKRQLSEMNQTIYNCVQCLCQFSRENSNDYKIKLKDIECPECKSKFIAEVTTNVLKKNSPIQTPVVKLNSEILKTFSEENSSVTNPDTLSSVSETCKNNALQQQVETQNYTQIKEGNSDQEIQNDLPLVGNEKNHLEESSSHSSIGSAGSLIESSSCSKISQNSFDSNQSVAGSSSNERDNDFNNMEISSNKYYNDSEVEILSNPSQSSIEVLDGFHSSRKTSEERRVSRIPSLETIEDSSIRNFSFKIGEDNTTMDLISGVGLMNDNNRTITSKDITAEFLKKEIKETLAKQQKNNDEVENTEKINKRLGIIEKKISTGQLNLTESSSSGSVTDSICTTYEQENKINNDIATTAKIDGKDEKEAPYMFNILGGLFQSSNKTISKSEKSLDSDVLNATEKFKYNYNNFDDIDHRLKFYFGVNKFNIKNEYFKWLVKCKFFDGNTLRYFKAIVAMSTCKLYIMEIIGVESDDPAKWLKEILSVSNDRLESLQLLPFKAGLSMAIRNYSETFLMILQDISRTDSLMLFFTNNALPNNCSLEYQPSEIVITKLLSLTGKNKLKMFAILNSCEYKASSNDTDSQFISPAGFYTTDDHLYLTSSNLSWLSENLDKSITLCSVQKMSNLVEIKKLENNILEICFTDERIDSHNTWKCTFGTQENADTFLNAIEQSWEKIFGVPLLNN
ncbi:serine/threonine-protein kinase 11-interacting protein isoform X2 [Condylostylus longicornis]|uniref:serine/threonine-protein kinase 11-interacting protein isoform X2 n=1 Tax=Condylostylus longicornis TaxID=2530218 RepID=UPI00244E3B57|nr:serine/threonine-protein kinase 11-interacting protein isoform X2 [Condylostylus longicornis]